MYRTKHGIYGVLYNPQFQVSTWGSYNVFTGNNRGLLYKNSKHNFRKSDLTILKRIKHHDQVSFVPGMQG